MARQINRLNARKVATLSKPGRHADGGGLYLYIDRSGAKRWCFMSWRGGRQIELGLGGLIYVPLALARERAVAVRQTIADGRDPLQERRLNKLTPTFGRFADEVVASLESGWRNDKHRSQWRSTLAHYAGPLRDLPVNTITTEHVLSTLRPIWQAKPETASRVRGRIEKILDAAKAKGLRDGENPARWRGHLENLLPSRQRLSRGHHKAMPYVEVPSFMRRLSSERSISRLALEFTILTCARTGEVIGARWCEIDLKARVWTVPAQRMKVGREHRVPLAGGALKVLRALPERAPDSHVFHAQDLGAPLSNMAMAMVLRGLVGSAATVHGFRSAFRDWSAERTNFPREIAEAALAHTVGNSVERAYRRGDALEKRRLLMTAWDEFVSTGRKSAR